MKKPAIKEYHYHSWANNRFFEHLQALPDEVYDKEVESVFSSVSEVIAHIYQVDQLWLSVMAGEPFEQNIKMFKKAQKKAEGKSLHAMEKLYHELSDQYAAFFDEQDLDEVITTEHPQYGKLEVSVAELVQHVVNHGTYHRGNITAMLRQQGHASVPNDYIIYLNEIQ